MSKTYTFTKEERLCNVKLIDQLFHNGSSFLCYPFKVSWQVVTGQQPFPVQVLFSVSKKRYKKAVDRNLIKRRMREAYRLHKQTSLYMPLIGAGKQIILSIGFVGKEISPYEMVEKKLMKLFQQLNEQITR